MCKATWSIHSTPRQLDNYWFDMSWELFLPFPSPYQCSLFHRTSDNSELLNFPNRCLTLCIFQSSQSTTFRRTEISADLIFRRTKISVDFIFRRTKIFGTQSDFRQVCPPKFCPILYITSGDFFFLFQMVQVLVHIIKYAPIMHHGYLLYSRSNFSPIKIYYNYL